MPLTYGLPKEEDGDERFAALSDEEKEIYHNILPWALMMVDIGVVVKSTIPTIKKRLEHLGHKDWSETLSVEFLEKLIGYETNVGCVPLGEEWLAQKQNRDYHKLTVFYDETDDYKAGWWDDDTPELKGVALINGLEQWRDADPDSDDNDEPDYEKLVESLEDDRPGMWLLRWARATVRDAEEWGEDEMIENLDRYVRVHTEVHHGHKIGEMLQNYDRRR